jgi:hypothetical protein
MYGRSSTPGWFADKPSVQPSLITTTMYQASHPHTPLVRGSHGHDVCVMSHLLFPNDHMIMDQRDGVK